MWGALFGVAAGVILWIAQHWLPVAANNPLGILASSGDPSPWVDGMGIVGLFVDLPFLFAVLGVLMAWKGVWLLYRLWRTLLEAIPMAG